MSERDFDFMLGQSNQDEQIKSRESILCRGTCSHNASNPAQIKYPQVVAHKLKENNVSKVRSEVDNVMESVQDVVMTAIENLVIPRENWL